MATNNFDGGYDVHFTSEIPQELKCVICHLVLREPVQIMTCGHRFCTVCFEQFKTHTQRTAQTTVVEIRCPVDRAPILPDHVFPDRGVSRTIGNLKVQCGNRDRGCAWTDDLRDLREHERTCGFNVSQGSEDAIKQILSRLVKCEESLLNKDKDILNLKSTVDEMKENEKVKDAEIRLLKFSNNQLKTELSKKDEEIETLKEKIDQCQKEIENLNDLDDLEEDISSLQDRFSTMENEMKIMNSAAGAKTVNKLSTGAPVFNPNAWTDALKKLQTGSPEVTKKETVKTRGYTSNNRPPIPMNKSAQDLLQQYASTVNKTQRNKPSKAKRMRVSNETNSEE